VRNDIDNVRGPGRFPATAWSVLAGLASEDAGVRQRSFDALVAAYWKPVYKHLRLKWHLPSEDAEDVTQAFFLRAIEKDFFSDYDRSRARFRTFLRVCLDRFLANERAAAGRAKRGGEAQRLSLAFDVAEHELAAAGAVTTPEEVFDREWVRSLFSLAVEALRELCHARGKEVYYRLFERYDLADADAGRPTYRQLAEAFGLAETDVTNHLAAARRDFRRLVLEQLREITADEAEFQAEARYLLGVGAV
jgi:RNA polymerase sigma factor (sigma-70 family)